MSRSLSRGQAIVLAMVVCLGLGLGGVGLFAVGSQQWLWSPTFHIQVGFPNVRGVEEGTRVRVQGKDVGEVVAVQLPDEPGKDVMLKLRLGSQFRGRIRTDATAQILSEGMLGGRVVEIDPGRAATPVADGAVIASRPTVELAEVMNQVGTVLQSLDKEKGKVGELFQNSNQLLRQGQDTMASIQDLTEGVKRAPVIRNYVEDPPGLLYRPNCERSRRVFAAADLFEPGRAVLTGEGRQRLDELTAWLNGLTRHEGAEVVVAAFADPHGPDPAQAKMLTRQQSEAVCAHLKENGAIYKRFGLMARKVTPLGLGAHPSPVQEPEPLPPARIEVLVFVPQG